MDGLVGWGGGVSEGEGAGCTIGTLRSGRQPLNYDRLGWNITQTDICTGENTSLAHWLH